MHKCFKTGQCLVLPVANVFVVIGPFGEIRALAFLMVIFPMSDSA